MVVDDQFGSQQPDHVDHSMAQQLAPTPVGSCMETCCKTFVEKGSPNIDVDRTYRA